MRILSLTYSLLLEIISEAHDKILKVRTPLSRKTKILENYRYTIQLHPPSKYTLKAMKLAIIPSALKSSEAKAYAGFPLGEG